MLFIFSTPKLIRHLWQLKTIVFLHQYLICSVPLRVMLEAYPKCRVLQGTKLEQATALTGNIRLGQKWLTVLYTLAYFNAKLITSVHRPKIRFYILKISQSVSMSEKNNIQEVKNIFKKHSSLFLRSINDGEKSFITFSPIGCACESSCRTFLGGPML